MKTHKHIFTALFCSLLMMAFCLSGCGKNGQVDSTANPGSTGIDASSSEASTQKDSSTIETSTSSDSSSTDAESAKDSSVSDTNPAQDSAVESSLQDSAAADSSTSNDGGQQNQKVHIVDFTFDLPTGFKWSDGFTHRIESLTGSSDGVKGHMTLSVSAYSPAQPDDSKNAAAKEHADHDWPCPDGKFCPALYDITISGVKVYASTDYADYFWGKMTGYSNLYFSKNGVGYSIVLDDLPEGQLPALQTVISSLKIK